MPHNLFELTALPILTPLTGTDGEPIAGAYTYIDAEGDQHFVVDDNLRRALEHRIAEYTENDR